MPAARSVPYTGLAGTRPSLLPALRETRSYRPTKGARETRKPTSLRRQEPTSIL